MGQLLKIFLDDLRKPPNGWVLSLTARHCIMVLKTQHVGEISLDHDLGLSDETGYDVLLWIEEQVMTKGYVPPKINIHTANISARHKMELALKSIIKGAEWNLQRKT